MATSYHNIAARRIAQNSARRQSFNTTRNNIKVAQMVIGAFVLIAFLAAAGFGIFAMTKTSSHSACVVTHTDRVMTQDNGSEMRVYTDNCGTFTANDSLLDMKFNSGDLYGQLAKGGTFDLETRGIRLPLFSSFENIVTATPVK